MTERTPHSDRPLLERRSSLLTVALEDRRLEAPVAHYAVKGDPRTPPGNPPKYKEMRQAHGELEGVRLSMFNEFDIHAGYDGPGNLALIRKASPHGMNEMTVMARDGYHDTPVDNLFGFEPAIRRSFYEVGRGFSEYSEQQGLYPVMSYTYDPRTDDRKSAQSVKIYHLQLTARSEEEIDQMGQNVHSLAYHESSVERRQLIDEASIVYSLALYDYFIANPVGSFIPVAPFTADACSNLRFRIGDQWDDILTDEFDRNIYAIHHTMMELYTHFSDAAMSGEVGEWQRPELSVRSALDYIENLDWMQDDTKEIFCHFISGLQGSYLHKVEELREKGLTSHVYPLANFAYGTAINRNERGELMLSIRPQLFAETGGTGLQYIDPVGAHVKMSRGDGIYDADEIQAKERFEKDCAAYIVRKK